MVEINLEDAPIYAELTLNPVQSEFVTDRTPFLLGSGGKGGGKTVALCAKTIALLTNSEIFGDMAGNVGCIGRYREKDLRNTTLREMYKWLPKSWIEKENKDEGWILLCNQSTLFTTHYDNLDHITSFNLGFAAIDQMEEIPIDVFDELAYNRIRLRTMKRFRPDGTLINPVFSDEEPFDCISTDPDEIAAVLYDQTVFGVANPRPSPLYYKFSKNEEYRTSNDPRIRQRYNADMKYMEIPTTDNLKWLPKDYVARQLRDKSTRQYERDVLGKLNAFEGTIYVDFTDDLINEVNVIPHPSWDIYVGLDHGGTGLDDSRATGVTSVVFTALEPRPGDWPLVHVFDELYLQASTIEESVAAIYDTLLAIHTAWRHRYPDIVDNIPGQIAHVKAWRCDPSMSRGIQDSNETIMTRYMRYARTLGFNMALAPGDNRIAENIERNSWLFRKKLVSVNPRCADFIDEHRAWLYGKNEKPKPMQSDHTCDSFAYCSSAYPFTNKRLDLPPKEPTLFEQRQRQQARNSMMGGYDDVYGYRTNSGVL